MATLKETLHAINVLEEDIDISVDGYDTIAVVAPIALSQSAKEHYKDALELQVSERTVIGSDKHCKLAWDLLHSLAGYCDQETFAKYFETNAEGI